MSTIFSKIINKEIDAEIIYEDNQVIAFEDSNPQAPIHILIVPKKEIKTINDVEDCDKILIGDMFIAAKKIAKKLAIDKNGYRLVLNCNDDGGQSVFHIHVHLLAGRKLSWPPG
ncbi:MAG: histidine triad nucleotide-binding protein [Candidatus Marinimicrobia bacterium]|nr:histidine triad nucleotide-binding protein [Candidatus Neomarinimicrobiota bacterium]|tara:strand:- start:2830 stop:3171 length:342 start_codon:yes stop_codon:yes gene_type:complete